MRRIWQRIYGINGFLLILYTTFIFSSYFFFSTEKETYWIRWTVFVFALAAVLCPMLLRRLAGWEIRGQATAEDESSRSRKERKRRLIFFLAPFGLFLAKYLIYYPGGFSFDVYTQYGQALTGDYIDWHPVIQTLISIKLPLMISGGWIGSITLFQIIIQALVIAYAMETIREYAGDRYAMLSLLFILLNPSVSNIAMFPWKDAAFATGALLMVSYTLRIYFSGGAWLKKPGNAILFILTSALTSMVRHNAPLFTFTLLFAITIQIGWKRMIAVIVGIAAVMIGVKGPLYSALNVHNPGYRKVEMLGMPMAIIGAVAKYAPEDLDEETAEFVKKLAPANAWAAYEYGNFNLVKWTEGFDVDLAEETGLKMIPMAIRCILRSPREALKGLIRLTDPVYTICDDYTYTDFPLVQGNSYGIVQAGIPALQTVNEKLGMALYTVLPWLFLYSGAMVYVLLAVILAKYRLNRWKDWKKFFFALPIVAYNFGTALLLTGAHDSSRFFYYTFMVMPAVLMIVGCKDPKGEAGETAALTE